LKNGKILECSPLRVVDHNRGWHRAEVVLISPEPRFFREIRGLREVPTPSGFSPSRGCQRTMLE
jgi:hypothetical protein